MGPRHFLVGQPAKMKIFHLKHLKSFDKLQTYLPNLSYNANILFFLYSKKKFIICAYNKCTRITFLAILDYYKSRF